MVSYTERHWVAQGKFSQCAILKLEAKPLPIWIFTILHASFVVDVNWHLEQFSEVGNTKHSNTVLIQLTLSA